MKKETVDSVITEFTMMGNQFMLQLELHGSVISKETQQHTCNNGMLDQTIGYPVFPSSKMSLHMKSFLSLNGHMLSKGPS